MSRLCCAWALSIVLPFAWAEDKPEPGRAPTQGVMALAEQILSQAQQLETRAGTYIRRGNDLRKRINQLRASARRQQDQSARQGIEDAARVLAEQMEHWQQQGGELRLQSSTLQQWATLTLIEGFVVQWSAWIESTTPLFMDALAHEVSAHNNQVRSVRPRLLGVMPTAQDMPARHLGMSIKVPALAGQQAPESLNVSSFQVARDRHYFAHIEVASDSVSADQVPLNKIHSWRLLVSDLRGQPVSGASIVIEGHMPGHVHGLPTQPEVTTEIAPGVYRVDGVKFQMNGWWVIDFIIEHQGRPDTVQFNLLL